MEKRRGIDCIFYPSARWRELPVLYVREEVERGGYYTGPYRWTDGGSIPWFARAFINPLGHLFFAYLVHDCALADGLGWVRANRIFRQALEEEQAARWERIVILAGVWIGAGWQYARHVIGLEGKYVKR